MVKPQKNRPCIEPIIPEVTHLTSLQLLLMSIATGIAVSGNYFAQPLLNTIAQELSLTQAQAGTTVTISQLAYGIGLLFLVPLADLLERRFMIVVMMSTATLGLLICATAGSLFMLIVASAIIGLSTVVTHIMVPHAATLSAPERQGHAIGKVMSGLLIGILLARTFAGGLSSIWGWRSVYWLASLIMVLSTLSLWHSLPRYKNPTEENYGGLILSMLRLPVEEPIFLKRALLGLLSFAIFSLFWTPLAFFLAETPSYQYNDAQIGLFGLAGAAGAWGASLAGRMADRGKLSLTTQIGIGLALFSWILLAASPQSLSALIAGTVLLDFALQLIHVSNQNCIFVLRPEMKGRLNGAYMIFYFIGGAIGSWLGLLIFERYQWNGIVICGLIISSICLFYRGK